jgi:mannose-6-phosphate isomerase-like protein (cupin superfamily)
MSFPHGEIVLGAGEGKTISVLGASYTYKAAKEETRGAYALIEHTVAGDGPPPHIHATEEEAFYLLEGELNVVIGERTVTAKAGAFVLVPRGTVHTFSKAGTASAKVLVIISPAGFEKFFEEIAGPPDLDKIKALAPKYNLEIVGPGPEQGDEER